MEKVIHITMSKAEQKKLLDDKWPKAPKRSKSDFAKAIKKAAKSGLFELKQSEHGLACG